MSELINARMQPRELRWQLLTTVSVASLLLAVSATAAVAEDTDHPTIWIELGGQLEASRGKEEPYIAPFISNNFDDHQNATSPLSAQKPPRNTFGGEGKLSFEPAGSDWSFSAAIRYGRSSGKKSTRQQTQSQFVLQTFKYTQQKGLGLATYTRFNNSDVKYSTTHTIVDFMAGKDVGLGMFGTGTLSTFNAGVRFAQFGTRSDVVFHSIPSFYAGRDLVFHSSHAHHHTYYAHADVERTFRGVGPSISWAGSAPFLGNRDAGEVTFDWGANAAALFGRQKVRGSHETTGAYLKNRVAPLYYARTVPLVRSHSVVVPNVGGFAGLSVRYPNIKFSLGYRADFYFGAMDGGADVRNSTTQGFYGPFATFAVGLGG